MAGEKGSKGATKPGVRAFRLGDSGLERVLGELEAPIMEAIWQAGEASIQELCDRLGPAANYKTVMTVTNRLVQKGLLSRRRVSKAFVYSPVESRRAFLDRISRSVVAGLVRDFGTSAIAQFVDVVDEVAPEELEALEALIHRRVERGQAGGTL
jgi:predicted transcriptional regulator